VEDHAQRAAGLRAERPAGQARACPLFLRHSIVTTCPACGRPTLTRWRATRMPPRPDTFRWMTRLAGASLSREGREDGPRHPGRRLGAPSLARGGCAAEGAPPTPGGPPRSCGPVVACRYGDLRPVLADQCG